MNLARFRVAINHNDPSIVSQGLNDFTIHILKENNTIDSFGYNSRGCYNNDKNFNFVIFSKTSTTIQGELLQFITTSTQLEELFALWDLSNRNEDKLLCSYHMTCFASILHTCRSNETFCNVIVNRILHEYNNSIINQLSTDNINLIHSTLGLLITMARISKHMAKDIYYKVNVNSNVFIDLLKNNKSIIWKHPVKDFNMHTDTRYLLILLILILFSSLNNDQITELLAQESVFRKILGNLAIDNKNNIKLLLNGLVHVQRDSFYLDLSTNQRLVTNYFQSKVIYLCNNRDKDINKCAFNFISKYIAAILDKNSNTGVYRQVIIQLIKDLPSHKNIKFRQMICTLLQAQPSLLPLSVTSVSITWDGNLSIEHATTLTYLSYLLNSIDIDNSIINKVTTILDTNGKQKDHMISKLADKILYDMCLNGFNKKDLLKVINHSNLLIIRQGLLYVTSVICRLKKLITKINLSNDHLKLFLSHLKKSFHNIFLDFNILLSVKLKLVQLLPKDTTTEIGDHLLNPNIDEVEESFPIDKSANISTDDFDFNLSTYSNKNENKEFELSNDFDFNITTDSVNYIDNVNINKSDLTNNESNSDNEINIHNLKIFNVYDLLLDNIDIYFSLFACDKSTDILKLLDDSINLPKDFTSLGSNINLSLKLSNSLMIKSIDIIDKYNDKNQHKWFGTKDDCTKMLSNIIVLSNWKDIFKKHTILLKLLLLSSNIVTLNESDSNNNTSNADIKSKCKLLLENVLIQSGLFEGHQVVDLELYIELKVWIDIATATRDLDVLLAVYTVILLTYHWNLELCLSSANIKLSDLMTNISSTLPNTPKCTHYSPLLLCSIQLSNRIFNVFQSDLPNFISNRVVNIAIDDNESFFIKYDNGYKKLINQSIKYLIQLIAINQSNIVDYCNELININNSNFDDEVSGHLHCLTNIYACSNLTNMSYSYLLKYLISIISNKKSKLKVKLSSTENLFINSVTCLRASHVTIYYIQLFNKFVNSNSNKVDTEIYYDFLSNLSTVLTTLSEISGKVNIYIYLKLLHSIYLIQLHDNALLTVHVETIRHLEIMIISEIYQCNYLIAFKSLNQIDKSIYQTTGFVSDCYAVILMNYFISLSNLKIQLSPYMLDELALICELISNRLNQAEDKFTYLLGHVVQSQFKESINYLPDHVPLSMHLIKLKNRYIGYNNKQLLENLSNIIKEPVDTQSQTILCLANEQSNLLDVLSFNEISTDLVDSTIVLSNSSIRFRQSCYLHISSYNNFSIRSIDSTSRYSNKINILKSNELIDVLNIVYTYVTSNEIEDSITISFYRFVRSNSLDLAYVINFICNLTVRVINHIPNDLFLSLYTNVFNYLIDQLTSQSNHQLSVLVIQIFNNLLLIQKFRQSSDEVFKYMSVIRLSTLESKIVDFSLSDCSILINHWNVIVKITADSSIYLIAQIDKGLDFCHPLKFIKLLLSNELFDKLSTDNTDKYNNFVNTCLSIILSYLTVSNQTIDNELVDLIELKCITMYHGTMYTRDRLIFRLFYVLSNYLDPNNQADKKNKIKKSDKQIDYIFKLFQNRTLFSYLSIKLVNNTISSFPRWRGFFPQPFLCEDKSKINIYKQLVNIQAVDIISKYHSNSKRTEIIMDISVDSLLHDYVYIDHNIDDNSNIYDPSYLIRFIYYSLHHSDLSIRQLSISGGLSIIIQLLSSACVTIRSIAMSSLARVFELINQQTPNIDPSFKERQMLTYLLSLVRNSVVKDSESQTENYILSTSSIVFYSQLSNVVTTFLSKSILILLQPNHHLYTKTCKYLLSNPFINYKDLPLFESTVMGLSNFTDQENDPMIERLYSLRLIRDSIISDIDHLTINRVNIYNRLLLVYPIYLPINIKVGHIVIDILDKCLSIPSSASHLLVNFSILTWIYKQISNHDVRKSSSKDMTDSSTDKIKNFNSEMDINTENPTEDAIAISIENQLDVVGKQIDTSTHKSIYISIFPRHIQLLRRSLNSLYLLVHNSALYLHINLFSIIFQYISDIIIDITTSPSNCVSTYISYDYIKQLILLVWDYIIISKYLSIDPSIPRFNRSSFQLFVQLIDSIRRHNKFTGLHDRVDIYLSIYHIISLLSDRDLDEQEKDVNVNKSNDLIEHLIHCTISKYFINSNDDISNRYLVIYQPIKKTNKINLTNYQDFNRSIYVSPCYLSSNLSIDEVWLIYSNLSLSDTILPFTNNNDYSESLSIALVVKTILAVISNQHNLFITLELSIRIVRFCLVLYDSYFDQIDPLDVNVDGNTTSLSFIEIDLYSKLSNDSLSKHSINYQLLYQVTVINLLSIYSNVTSYLVNITDKDIVDRYSNYIDITIRSLLSIDKNLTINYQLITQLVLDGGLIITNEINRFIYDLCCLTNNFISTFITIYDKQTDQLKSLDTTYEEIIQSYSRQLNDVNNKFSKYDMNIDITNYSVIIDDNHMDTVDTNSGSISVIDDFLDKEVR